MKIVVISDLHGKSIWEQIVEEEKDADEFIFAADYFDAFENTADVQIPNLLNILNHPLADKFTLLWGNHDQHYIPNMSRCSGYQDLKAADIWEAIREPLKAGRFKICRVVGSLLFSHAGITTTWAKDNEIDLDNLENSVNSLFRDYPESFDFVAKLGANGYGDNAFQGPLWVRPKSLMNDKLEGYTQIVGHTAGATIRERPGIFLTDCLDHRIEYLVIEDGVFTKKVL